MKLRTYSSPLLTYGLDCDILTQGFYILRHLFVSNKLTNQMQQFHKFIA